MALQFCLFSAFYKLFIPTQGAKRRRRYYLSRGYPPVGIGVTKGVLSEGYMLAWLLVWIRSCIKTMSVTRFASYRRRSMSIFGSMYVCMSVRNKRRRQYHQIVTKFLFKTPEKMKISNRIATFDLRRISRTSEGGRPNAPKIATTTEYCP